MMEFNKPDAGQPTILHKQSPIKPLKSQRNQDVVNKNRKNCEIMFNKLDVADNSGNNKRRLFSHFSLETEPNSKPTAPSMLRLPKIGSNYKTNNPTAAIKVV